MNIGRFLLFMLEHFMIRIKNAVISNRTLIDYFAFEPSNSKDGFLSEFTQMICAAA